METLTIPRKLTRRGDLVVIPRKEYEELLRVHKQQKKVEKVSDAEKQRHTKFYAQLDKDLAAAIKEYKEGKAIGPFTSIEELRKSLKNESFLLTAI